MVNYSIEYYSDRLEWLNNRCIGGSSASAILGVNRWQTPLDLYMKLISDEKITNDNTNEILEYGHKAESILIDLFKLDFDGIYKVISDNQRITMYRRIDKPYITATYDGVLEEIGTGRIGVLEIKTHEVRGDLNEWNNALPNEYYSQCIHYFVSRNDVEFVILCVKLKFKDFNTNKVVKQEIRYYHIERGEVEKDIKFLEDKETYFWEHNICKRIMPSIVI